MVTKNPAYRAWLENVPDDKAFWCCDSRVFKSLDELCSALRDMSEETYRYHVTSEKNDFSNWVRDVIGDVTLSRNLQKTTTPGGAGRKVEARLLWIRERV